MPEISPQKRASGGRSWANPAHDPHDGAECDCDWDDPSTWTAANLRHRRIPPPDQTRYGPKQPKETP